VIDVKAFKAGMEKLGAAFNRALTTPVLDVYGGMLSPRLSTEQWAHAVTRAIESETYFPPPAVLLRYGAGDRGLSAAAGSAYDLIVRCYERGESLGYRQVRDEYGLAAAEAFIAAGGDRRFAWCEPEDEPFRLKDFRAAYVEQAEVDPISALPPGDSPEKALPYKTDADALRAIAKPRTGPGSEKLGAWPAEAPGTPRGHSTQPIRDTEERRAELQRQAGEILAGRE
jgi:hypothetical protein